ncbi:MAG: PAS domain S-box protein [Gemmatimonadota bacterium]
MASTLEQRLLRQPSGSARRRALGIAFTYGLVAAIWVLGTDRLLLRFNPDAAWHAAGDALKGGFFILVTAALLYALLHAYFRRSEHVASHLDLLARRSTDMIFRYRLHPERGFEYVSPAATALTGYTPAEHYADPELPLKIVHPDDRATLHRQMEDPAAVGESDDLRWVRKDGAIIWMEMRSTVIVGPDGQPTAVEGIVRDVTARRERDERRRILEAAVEAANDSVMITAADGQIEYVNPAFSRITGWSREAALGKNPRILRSGAQDRAFYRRMWRTLTAGRAFQGRFVNRRADGSRYTQEATIAPLTDAAGRMLHYVAVARDVTEREMLERQLREAQLAEIVGQFVAGVSHDFRNLLGIVRGQVQEAAASRAEGRYPEAELAQIDAAAERGVELVRKLLTLGRTGEVAPRPVSLVEIVDGLGPALRAMLPPSVTLDLALPPDDKLQVHADRGSIEQILLNLVGNARDALRDGGTITLGAERARHLDAAPGDRVEGVTEEPADGWVRLSVRDDGVGMTPDVLERMFEPFYTTKPAGQGTGLGMPMVVRLARLHGGAVTVHSCPREGTTVALLLPALAAAGLGEATTEPQAPALPHGHGERILVVEDEEPLRQVQLRALERLGYAPVEARDGEDALRILEREGAGIDLVMTDLIMPGRGGRALYDSMGQLGLRGVPVVFMSGYARADLPGVVGARFLEKPWTLYELARTVAGALEDNRRAEPAEGTGAAATA